MDKRESEARKDLAVLLRQAQAERKPGMLANLRVKDRASSKRPSDQCRWQRRQRQVATGKGRGLVRRRRSHETGGL